MGVCIYMRPTAFDCLRCLCVLAVVSMKYRCRTDQFGKLWEKAIELQMAIVTAHNAATKKKELQLSKDVMRLELSKRV